MQMIYLKVHVSDNGKILAMCDSTLIDKILTEGELEINIKDYSEFYSGQLIAKEGALSLIKREEIITANIVGEEAVKIALEKKIIEKSHIKKISNVPYANAFRLNY